MREASRLKALKRRSGDEPAQKKKILTQGGRRSRQIRRGSFTERLGQAGINLPMPIYVALVCGGCLFVSVFLTELVGQLVGVIVGPALCHFFFSTYLTGRAEKRRNSAVPHLPGFIDTLSASLSTGYNMETAIEHGANALPPGVLKVEFTKVSRMIEKGMTLDEVLDLMGNRIAGQEMVALLITIRMFSDMGGRVLTPFKRLGNKMREQQAVLERATRDLVGTKQAFYVILGLSVTAPLLMLANDPNYIIEAFRHPIVKWVMQGAIVVQIACFMFFKKFTTIRI